MLGLVNIKKLTAWVVAGCLLLGSGLVIGADKSREVSSEKKVLPQYIFALAVPKGFHFNHEERDVYVASIPNKDIHSVLAFSDRPDRKAFYMSPQKFAKMVHSGSQSFDNDPPNLALVFGENPAAFAFTIQSYEHVDESIKFRLKFLGGAGYVDGSTSHQVSVPPVTYDGGASMFIDSMNFDMAKGFEIEMAEGQNSVECFFSAIASLFTGNATSGC